MLALRTSPGLPDDVFAVAPHIYNLTYDLLDYARSYVAEVSIGTQTGPPIGVQKDPLLVHVSAPGMAAAEP